MSRLVALMIDGVVVTVLVLVVATIPKLTWAGLSPATMPHGLARIGSGIAMAVPVLYFTTLWTMTGRTLGGMATGIVVEHRDGHRLSLPHAFVRAAVGLLLAPLWLVGMLFILADRRRRAWHDWLMHTDVRYDVAGRPGGHG